MDGDTADNNSRIHFARSLYTCIAPGVVTIFAILVSDTLSLATATALIDSIR